MVTSKSSPEQALPERLLLQFGILIPAHYLHSSWPTQNPLPVAFALQSTMAMAMALQILSQALAQAAAHKLMSLTSQLWICCSPSIAAKQLTPAASS